MEKTINGLNISGIADDSRKVKKGNLFVAIKGLTSDGHDYIADAIKNGAKAIIGETPTNSLNIPPGVVYKQVSDSKKALGEVASEWFGNPSQKLKVIGVTGTDGKTTTSTLLYWILKKSGKKVGLVSTVSAIIGDRQYDTGFHVTNPEPLALQGFLAEMVKAGCKYAVLEVTSHGIAQERISGIQFDMAILTNITHEHLDYHKTFENYRDTKLSFLQRAKVVILNKNDANFNYLYEKLKVKHKILTYSHKLTSDYNLSNILAASTAANELGVSQESIKKALQSFKLPKGRLQEIKTGKDFKVIVDFAHTPNALENVLGYLRTKTQKRLIAVFGSAGHRDATKRPLMGKVASERADIVILTAEDPRTEKVEDINAQIKSGIKGNTEFYSIPDRQEAINFALKLAKKGDLVGIFGKGHEESMNLDGKSEIPWSDQKAVLKAVKILNN